MDTYADDLAELFEQLDLKDAVMIGHSTGGGEVARFIGRHGTKRVANAVLMGAVPPLMLKTDANPGGLPMEVFDGFREQYLADRSQFFLDVASGPFFGFNRPGAKFSQGLIQSWWRQGMMSGHKNAYDCIKAFSETDFTEDLKKVGQQMDTAKRTYADAMNKLVDGRGNLIAQTEKLKSLGARTLKSIDGRLLERAGEAQDDPAS